jgi:hypothetical protein
MKCPQLFGCDFFPPDPNGMFLQRHGLINFLFTYLFVSAAISSNKGALKNSTKNLCGGAGICPFHSGL